MAKQIEYYLVGISNKWTKDAKPESFFLTSVSKVEESRIDSEAKAGIKTLWINGRNMGKLFPSQALQVAYLVEKGLL